MQSLIRGQKIKLSDLSRKNQFQIGLAILSSSNLTFDISCFGVDDNNKLSDDRYFIFFNQKTSPCGSLSSLGPRNGDQEIFNIDLLPLPSTIRKLVFVVTIDGDGVMSQIRDGYLRLLDQFTELTRFAFSGSDFKDEKAIIVGEIYFKDVWRFSAVGQGFNGGLSALLRYFGGQEIIEPTLSESQTRTIQTQPPKPVMITLAKKGEKSTINLNKKVTANQILAKLTWTDKVDLDLHAFVISKSGKFEHIFFANKGSVKSSPYIYLDKDSGVGATGGDNEENITVAKVDDIRILVFATHIFRFLPFLHSNDNFSKYNGKVVVTSSSGDVITVPMNSKEKGRWCLIAGVINDSAGLYVYNINRVEQNEPTKESIERF